MCTLNTVVLMKITSYSLARGPDSFCRGSACFIARKGTRVTMIKVCSYLRAASCCKRGVVPFFKSSSVFVMHKANSSKAHHSVSRCLCGTSGA